MCREYTAVIEGEIPMYAQNKPLEKDIIIRQFSKLGNTPFELDHIDVTLDEGLFMTMGYLNSLRREALDKLTEEILKDYCTDRQNTPSCKYKPDNNSELLSKEHYTKNTKLSLSALCSCEKQVHAAIDSGKISVIYVESYCKCDNLKLIKEKCLNNKVSLYLAMPHVFRLEDQTTFGNLYDNKLDLFEGFLIRNIEEYFYLKERDFTNFIFDYNIYSFNKFSKKLYSKFQVQTTVPVELNSRELQYRGCNMEEMVVYGYMPVMTTANCIAKTMKRCDKSNGNYILNDRLNNNMSVRCVCDYCYNIIYNSNPLSLISCHDMIEKLGVASLRLEFTNEQVENILSIINNYYNAFI